MKENDKKRKIIFTVVFILLAIVLLIGSSYAYFSLGVDTSQSKPTTITGKTSKLGNVTLKGLIDELHLNLSASDMAKSNTGDYFATKDPDKSYEKEQEAGTYQISSLTVENVNDDTKYSCTANVKVIMTIDGENNMGSVIQENDLFLYLKGGNLDKEIDLQTIKDTGTGTYPIEFSTTGPEIKYLEAYVKLVNKEDEQNYLAGKTLNMEIITEGLKCTNDKSMTGLELAKSGSKGLKETPDTGDLAYRYVGTADNNPDNYICFGTSDKEECIGVDKDKYIYRIIGIDENGRLKLIRNSATELSIQWHNNYDDNAVWDSSFPSDLYNSLNGTGFLNKETYISTDWKIKIDDTTWNIGNSKIGTGSDNDGEGAGTGKTDTGANVWKWESASSASTPSKIGLMYLSDYYYSLDGSGSLDCYTTSGKEEYQTCQTSWLHISNNGVTGKSEWTMSRYGQHSTGTNSAWRLVSNGSVDNSALNSTYVIRPVFYLTANSQIIDGTGTVDDPFILEDPNKKGIELAQKVFDEIPEGFKTTPTGDLYRFVGKQSESESINNYVCFGADNCDANETNDHLYRIIGITEEGNIKIQKNKALESTAQWHSSNYDVTWGSNTLLMTTLKDYYDGLGTTLQEKIETEHTWNTGDVNGVDDMHLGTGDIVYGHERKESGYKGTIGLAYMSDYYYAYNYGGSQTCDSDPYCKSWMIPSDYRTLWGSVAYEWTMIRRGYYSSDILVWCITSGGMINTGDIDYSYAVRPVFYLNSDVTLTTNNDSSGVKGSLDNPWIIK